VIFFILSFLERLGSCNIRFMKYLANISFAIYFIHPWVIFFVAQYQVLKPIEFLPGVLIFLINFLFVMVASILIARTIKLVLNDRSRYLIGW